MKTKEEIENILSDNGVDRRNSMLQELLDRDFSYEDIACLLVGVFDQINPSTTAFKNWCDHMEKEMNQNEKEVAQLTVIGRVTYKNVEHDLIQEVEVTQKVFDRLKEREADGEIFIMDFKGGDAK